MPQRRASPTAEQKVSCQTINYEVTKYNTMNQQSDGRNAQAVTFY